MFDGASDAIFDRLVELAEGVSFSVGEELITQGKRCEHLYFSISGEFAIFVQDGEVQQNIASVSGYGKVVGEIGAVSGLPATATVRVTSEAAEFLKLDGAGFQKIISVEPELASTVLRSLARYLRGKN